MIATETELATFKELSEKRLQKIELKKDLEESRCIMTCSFILVYSYHLIVQKEELISKLKSKVSSLEEEREHMKEIEGN